MISIPTLALLKQLERIDDRIFTCHKVASVLTHVYDIPYDNSSMKKNV